MIFLRHIFEYILIILLFMIFRVLSFEASSIISMKIIKFIGPKHKFHQRAKKNIKIAFPDISDSELDDILLKMWENLGRSIGEFPKINSLSLQKYQEIVKIHNLENLNYLNDGGLIYSAHIANWELVPYIFRQSKKEICVIYRKANNPFVEKLVKNLRKKNNVTMIPKGKSGAKQIIKAIKEKKIIIMLVDQRLRDGIEVPFFGVNAMTAPAIASLAIEYQLPIISIYSQRVENAQHKFEIFISKPLQFELTKDKKSNIYSIMLKINKTIEEWIKQNPAQWFWIHDRWSNKKTHQ